MIKPTHHFRSAPEIKCAHVKVTFTVEAEYIKTIINSVLNDVNHKKWQTAVQNRGNGLKDIPIDENLITRQMVEERIRDRFKWYGNDGCDREDDKKKEFAPIESNKELMEKYKVLTSEREETLKRLATKLFPDWFPPPNSIKLIKELYEEEKK